MSAQNRIEMESHKDPDTLEREIEAKRRSISSAVDELEHKLSPGELFDRALGYVRGNGGEFAHNLGDTLKANPVPTVLTSIGLLWLMAGPKHPSPRHAFDRHGSEYGDHARSDIYGTDGEHRSAIGERAAVLKERAASMKDSMSERVHDASQRVSDAGHRIGEMGSRISERSHHAARRMRRSARHASHGFSRMLDEQPLAIGAIGIALGALVAALLPPTRREDEWLGAAADRTRQHARQMAESGLDSAGEALQSKASGDGRQRSGASGQSAGSMGTQGRTGSSYVSPDSPRPGQTH